MFDEQNKEKGAWEKLNEIAMEMQEMEARRKAQHKEA